MKKIYSLLLASALVFTSCSDFLDTKPQGKLTQDIFFGEEEGALMGINAIYSQMKSWDLIGFSWFGIMEVPSDNSDTGSSPADGSYARVNSLNDFTYDVYTTYNRENETYNFLKRNVQFSLFFHPIKAKAFNHHLSGN